jgi:hypothetical protein
MTVKETQVVSDITTIFRWYTQLRLGGRRENYT